MDTKNNITGFPTESGKIDLLKLYSLFSYNKIYNTTNPNMTIVNKC